MNNDEIKNDIKNMTIRELCNELCENIEESKRMYRDSKNGLCSEDEFEKIFKKNCKRNEEISRELACRPDSEFLSNKYMDKINSCLINENESDAKKLVNMLTLEYPALSDKILSCETKGILAGKSISSIETLRLLKEKLEIK